MKKFYLLFIFLKTISCFAQEEMETDRPDQTECSSVVSQKSIQVETGLVYSKNLIEENLETAKLHTYNYGTTLIRIGVSKYAELRIIAGEYETIKKVYEKEIFYSEGFAPIKFGTKIKVSDEHGIIPQTVLISHIGFTIDEKNKISKYVIPSFRFSMSHKLSEKFKFGYNLGMEWEAETTAPTYIYTFTLGANLSKKTSMYIEWFGGISSVAIPETLFDGGFAFLVFNNLQLDISAGYGLNEFSPDYYLSAGLSFRLPH